MNKLLFISLLLVTTSGALAQELTCIDKLLPNNRYSGLHQVVKEEWNDENPELSNVNAKAALIFLLRSKLFCKDHEFRIVIDPICSKISPDLPKSITCFAHTNAGYFTFSRDVGRNMNFIFSRDKTYSDP